MDPDNSIALPSGNSDVGDESCLLSSDLKIKMNDLSAVRRIRYDTSIHDRHSRPGRLQDGSQRTQELILRLREGQRHRTTKKIEAGPKTFGPQPKVLDFSMTAAAHDEWEDIRPESFKVLITPPTQKALGTCELKKVLDLATENLVTRRHQASASYKQEHDDRMVACSLDRPDRDAEDVRNSETKKVLDARPRERKRADNQTELQAADDSEKAQAFTDKHQDLIKSVPSSSMMTSNISSIIISRDDPGRIDEAERQNDSVQGHPWPPEADEKANYIATVSFSCPQPMTNASEPMPDGSLPGVEESESKFPYTYANTIDAEDGQHNGQSGEALEALEELKFGPVAEADNNTAEVISQPMTSWFPIAHNDRLTEMIMAVHPDTNCAGRGLQSSKSTTSNARSIQSRVTCPRTPLFARKKQDRVQKPPSIRHPADAAQGGRPASRIQSARKIPSAVPAADNAMQRSSAARKPLVNSAGINFPIIEGIARKPSAVVQIPDFTRSHKMAERRASRPVACPTQPEVGRTPGRTSRARMRERAEFDKANQDYQTRREEALKRQQKEKEDAEWQEECALRERIAFRANPVPSFIRGRQKQDK